MLLVNTASVSLRMRWSCGIWKQCFTKVFPFPYLLHSSYYFFIKCSLGIGADGINAPLMDEHLTFMLLMEEGYLSRCFIFLHLNMFFVLKLPLSALSNVMYSGRWKSSIKYFHVFFDYISMFFSLGKWLMSKITICIV